MKCTEHLCNQINFMKTAELQEEIYENLQQAYNKANAIYEQFRMTDLWLGRNKQALLDYMSLVMQLHGTLVKNGQSVDGSLLTGENVTQAAAYGLRKAAVSVGAVGSESEITGKLGTGL